MDLRLILNGKKAAIEPVRAAIYSARSNQSIEVRVTWESGDVYRLVREAHNEGCQRLVVGGGDGTVKEIVDALMQLLPNERPELAILPLGTANDFATACTIPSDPLSALALAQSGSASTIDCVQANNQYFINVASGGFGAQVTTNTPVQLKNFLGGGAYTINGLIQAVNFEPYQGEMLLPGISLQKEVVIGAVCNGRQAGGGQQLAPGALINDGLLDLVALLHFPKDRLLQVIAELQDPGVEGEYVKRYSAPWAEWKSDVEVPINLDGEPIKAKKVRFDVRPGAIKLILPENCPLIKS